MVSKVREGGWRKKENSRFGMAFVSVTQHYDPPCIRNQCLSWHYGPGHPTRPVYLLLHTYTYTHGSRTQDAPALRTMDGGLKIFYVRTTLPTHIQCHRLMHNDLQLMYFTHIIIHVPLLSGLTFGTILTKAL